MLENIRKLFGIETRTPYSDAIQWMKDKRKYGYKKKKLTIVPNKSPNQAPDVLVEMKLPKKKKKKKEGF